MEQIIDRIQLGITSCYLVRQGDSALLVDCGDKGMGKALQKALGSMGMHLEQIKLILITHAHADHAGSCSEIACLTRARVAIHRLDRPWLERGCAPSTPAASGWVKVLSRVVNLSKRRLTFEPYYPQIILGDEGLSLDEFGITGRVIHTPGHTAGSISLLLSGGRAIVGDMAMNGFPSFRRPGLPLVAEDMVMVGASWRKLWNAGVVLTYPGHGGPFSAEAMHRWFN